MIQVACYISSKLNLRWSMMFQLYEQPTSQNHSTRSGQSGRDQCGADMYQFRRLVSTSTTVYGAFCANSVDRWFGLRLSNRANTGQHVNTCRSMASN
ncbi:hypothetical protein RRG08_025774 [Elysia crispata]|uniref:Uncharacterized protein n=1 Tax=Elysia crispata TaxID=231223 RepID=A0AAE1DZP1_9GAST|nr:hypothetical protein RRG08_025774 [Elysia crispata]